MITITILKNPFDYNEKEIYTSEYIPGKTALEYIQPYCMGLEDYVLSINGTVVENVTDQVLTSDDWLAVCPVVGKSGRDWFRIVGTMALGYYAGTWTGHWFKAGSFWANMAAGAVTAVGGMVLNHWFPPVTADKKIETKSSYNWNSARSQAGQGNALAVTYGTMRTAGQVLAMHVSSNDEDQYMNILLCGGEGQISSISDIRINDNPISYYQGITVETRLGTNDQKAIANFNDIYNDQSLAYELNTDGNWATQQTAGNAVEGMEITLQFPGGLYHVKKDGGLGDASVTVKVQYRKVGEESWSEFVTNTITESKNTAFFRTYRVDNLLAAQYEVRVQCTNKSGTSTMYSTHVYWTQLSSIMYDDFARPGKVLVAIKALATSQLSGGTPSITWLQTRDKVWVWNNEASKYEQKSATNPAWAAYDMIHRCRQIKNIHTGNNEFVVQGAPASRAVYQDFVNWAAFCDNRKLTFDYIFDTADDLWTLLQKPEIVGRGKVIMKGTRFGCVCDAPAEPVQLFTVGNILTDNFKETFISLKDRANAIEVSFSNKDKAYEKEVVTVYADNYHEAIEPNITQISLDGATTIEQAYREAKYLLRLNQYLARTVEHSADIDAIACQINDVVLLAHDVPQWGFSGRLLGATTTTLKLDREVTLEPDKSYAVAIQITNLAAKTQNDVQKIVTVGVKGIEMGTNNVMTTDTITLMDPLPMAPIKWDLYSFGETNKVIKPFRVLNISRDQDLRRKITCIEYIDEIYNETNDDIPKLNYSDLEITPEVSSVSVAEETYRQKDGTMISNLNISWYSPRNTLVNGYKVLYSSDNGNTWTQLCSGVTGLRAVIAGVKTKTTYLVKVCTINNFNIVSHGKISSIYVTGKDIPPSDVSKVSAVIDATNATKVVLSWTAVDDVDLAGYRIREGTKIVENLAQITTYTYVANKSRPHMFTVTAVDNSGNESTTAATATVQVTVEPVNIQDFVVRQRESDRSYLDLEWKAIDDTGLSHYEIRMGTNADWNSATVIATQLKATRFSYQLTTEGYMYFFIKAVNSSGYYSLSPAQVALQVGLKPDAVTNLTASQSTKDKSMVILSWDAVSGDDIAGYRITVGDRTYITKELTYRYEATKNAKYTFMVQAFTTAGFYSKATSCDISVMISAIDVSGFVVRQSLSDRTKVILTWDTPTELDVAYYVIKGGENWKNAKILGSRVTGTTFETSIFAEIEQSFLIKAVTLSGNESQYPAQVKGIFNLNPEPVKDIVLSQSVEDKTLMNISWTGILESDLAYYDVRVGSSWNDAKQIITTKETSCTYNLCASGTVKILIKAMNVAGFYSDETTKTLYCTVEPLAVSNFRVYQNGEYVQLYWDKATEADVVSYEIREGLSFDTASLVVTGQTTTSYKYIVDTERKYQYHIKAINKSGFYSLLAVSDNVIVSDLPEKNVIKTFDELSLQSGTKVNTAFGASQYNFGNFGGKFSDYSTMKFSDVGGSAVLKLSENKGIYQKNGTYTTEIKDMNKLITANITCDFRSNVILEGLGSAILQIRTSQDNKAWTTWQDFNPAQYTFRYVQMQVLLSTNDTRKTPEVNHLAISIDVPDNQQHGSVNVPIGGTLITFTKPYYTVPIVTPTAIGDNRFVQIINKNNTGFTAKIVDRAGKDIGGLLDWSSNGY